MDKITEVFFQANRVFICISDNSTIQYGATEEHISQLVDEKPLLIGAEVTSFTNDTEKGFLRLEYKSLTGRHRFIQFNYDPLAQKEYEERLDKTC
ncbi:MAG TPA: hypothetical protein DD990_09380 [Cyanobacteria bacterium UBA11368]|nr:hypothetical protein [Cyanobacteria bacterium UBA11368]